MNDAARHLALLTRTTEVVNSSLDLQEVMEAIAHEVAAALETDSAYVYLYDERTDELVLRATHGTSVESATKVPRMRRGEGITGAAAADRAPVTRRRLIMVGWFNFSLTIAVPILGAIVLGYLD